MDRCPTEVLDLICAEACTDDGYTGRALALVSKRISEISSRHALNSIALYGPRQISAFVALLEGREDKDRRVRHLYLTDSRRLRMELAPGEDVDNWMRRRLLDQQWLAEHLLDQDDDVFDPLPNLRILRIVAPHLRTLTYLIFTGRYLREELTMVTFPRLEELTLHASSLASTGPSPTGMLSVPTLRRLHIIQRYSWQREIVQLIADLAPHLTHLRHSRIVAGVLPPIVEHLLVGLERMLEDQGASNAPDTTQPRLPSSLQRVIVEWPQQVIWGGSVPLGLSDSPAAYPLREIACRDACKRIVVVRPHVWHLACMHGTDAGANVELYMDVKASWESRILGHEGIWRVDPADILAMHGLDEEHASE
ncbi:hypothetical protein OH77DRAFT_1518923 [Trametes cingulata]|nr:hypothetical protein OH77DRAFT_1518923 [Trametes cingulata]